MPRRAGSSFSISILDQTLQATCVGQREGGMVWGSIVLSVIVMRNHTQDLQATERELARAMDKNRKKKRTAPDRVLGCPIEAASRAPSTTQKNAPAGRRVNRIECPFSDARNYWNRAQGVWAEDWTKANVPIIGLTARLEQFNPVLT